MRNERHRNLSNRCLKEERVPFRHRRSVMRIVQHQEERRTDSRSMQTYETLQTTSSEERKRVERSK